MDDTIEGQTDTQITDFYYNYELILPTAPCMKHFRPLFERPSLNRKSNLRAL